jgi:hypothetical protein
MAEGTFLSWEEAQRLALPPDATVLIPPQPEPIDMAAQSAGPPPHPVWLDDAYVAESATRVTDTEVDPAAVRAAAERAAYGPGPVRLLANLIAYNALLEYAHSPPKPADEKKRTTSVEPEPKES